MEKGVFTFPITAIEESTANDDEVTDTVEQEEIYTSYSESSTSSQVLENEQTTNTSGANESVRSTTSTIEDGVYAFHNIGNSTMWMDTQYDSDDAGYHMQQYAYTSSPATTFSRGGLFKITSLANGRYVIRLMTNNLLTFELTSSGVFTKEIPANDEDVAAADTFFIESAGTGYYIRPYGSSYVVTANTSSSSGSSGAPNSYLTRVLKLSSTSTAKWDLIRYTDVHRYGYTIYNPTYWSDTGLIAGKETDASVTVWSTRPGVNTPYMSIATSSASYASFQWYEAESAIYITPHYEGTLNLNIQIRESASSGPTYSFTKTYAIGLPIEEGLYYIKNAHNSKIMDIEGPSMSDGAYIQQYAFSASRQSKWELVHFKDGYYYIQSNYSDKYVGVDTSENSIKQHTSQTSDLRRWEFEETDNGNYKIINRSTKKVISASSAYIGDGVNLVHTAYTDDTDLRDEWVLCPVDTYAHVTLPVVIMYDATMRNSSGDMREWFDRATTAFVEEFGIKFELVEVEYNRNLDLDPICIVDEEHLNSHCTSQCGLVSLCSDLHHTGAVRLLELDWSNNYYTIRLVGYGLCSYDTDEKTHNGYAGMAYVNGEESVVSIAYTGDAVMTMQHELTHNLGGSHESCLGENCALNNNMNLWCDVCRQAIRNKYY